jgi:hypothetical protein
MKKALAIVLAVTALTGVVAGCAYSGVGASGDKAVVARNDLFLYGILRKVFVCKVSDSGLQSCQSSEAP